MYFANSRQGSRDSEMSKAVGSLVPAMTPPWPWGRGTKIKALALLLMSNKQCYLLYIYKAQTPVDPVLWAF